MTAEAMLHVALATDRAYLPYCATTILSAVSLTPEFRVQLHVLHAELGPEDQERLADTVRGKAEVSFHLLDSATLAALPSKGAELGGHISWGRLLMPQLLPDVGRAVYLDADTLVVDSLAPLASIPLGGAPLGAVRNVVEPAMRGHVRALGIEDSREYFNAGMLVLDLDALRAEDTLAQVSRVVSERRDQLTWFDQDALNVVFAGRWAALPARWNAQNSFWTWPEWAKDVHGEAELAAARNYPAVLHFEGPWLCKPWHYLCQHAYVDRYRAVLAETPWAGQPLEERTPATRIIARMPRSWQTDAYIAWRRARAQAQRIRRINRGQPS